MRVCAKCNTKMEKGFKLSDGKNIIRVVNSDNPRDYMGEVNVSVCPQCGWIETYLSRVDKIRKYVQEIKE